MKNSTSRSSERGIALVVVLLMMAILSGLATGFALTGQIEGQMSQNEVYHAGARAAAEAGLNRAIARLVAFHDDVDLLAGDDLAVDNEDFDADVNDDNGSLSEWFGAGPYALDAEGRYTYEVQLLDDDHPLIHTSALSEAQLSGMFETAGTPFSDENNKIVLRAIGYGPSGTVVRLARMLEIESSGGAPTTQTRLSNPAILVNGDFEMNGNVTVTGLSGNVHANGNLRKTGTSGRISGAADATGTFEAEGNFVATGGQGGGREAITVPAFSASNYENLANYKLTSGGAVQTKVGGVWTNCGGTNPCPSTGWTWSPGSGTTPGTWSSSKEPLEATYYIDANVDIGPTQGSDHRAVSVIATGSINVHGNAKMVPHTNAELKQFVTDGDLKMDNGSDFASESSSVEGYILVRGQFDGGGNIEFRGRVVVRNETNSSTLVTSNRIHGSVTFTYDGTLPQISTTVVVTGTPTRTYNVVGWLEQ